MVGNLRHSVFVTFFIPVMALLLIFQLTSSLYAKTAQAETHRVRVGLITNADKLAFKTTGKYQLINKKSGEIIANLKPGERWELTVNNNRMVLTKNGEPAGEFNDPLVVQGATATQVSILSAVTTISSNGSNLAALSGDGKVTNLGTDLSKYQVRSASGVQPMTAGNSELALITLEGPGNTKRYRGDMEFKISNTGQLVAINELPVEEYLYGVVPSEMPVSFGLEALKAQALAARTYALRAALNNKNMDFDLAPTDASQVYGGYDAESPMANRAVQETAGEVITYQGQLIDAVFFSSSGGFTDNSEDVWKNYVPYLRWKEDPYDKNDKHYNWVVYNTVDQLTNRVNQGLAQLGYQQQFGQVQALEEVARTSSGARVKAMRINGLGLDGSPLTVEVANADRVRVVLGLKSSLFTWEQQRDEAGNLTAITITGSGWGHGLGMSQYGARGMAEQGYNYRQILQYYYTGVDIVPNYGR